MSSFRSFDAFIKPRDDLRTKSALGGFITLVASIAASILFIAQIYLYVVGEARHSLHLSSSSWVPIEPALTTLSSRNSRYGSNSNIKHKTITIPLKVKVTFPRVPCKDLDVTHDSASYTSGDFQKIHGYNAITFRKPTKNQLMRIFPNEGDTLNVDQACTIDTNINIPAVGGTFYITVSKRAWEMATSFVMFGARSAIPKFHNVSNYVHSITFGEQFPLAHNPLKDVAHVFENTHGGVGLSNINVRLVPTKYKTAGLLMNTEKEMYQTSVTQHQVKPETLASSSIGVLPGLALTYDFTPLAVHHVEYRESFFVFLGSLVSIVGGVFVTVGLITSCLVHSAAAVAKKID